MKEQVEEALRVRRLPERGRYDRETINAILDEALFCHIGFFSNGQPVVIPTLHARVEDVLYVHGSQASRMLRELRGGTEVCVTATILDGLVLARSVFNHSMNYRSVVVFGRARAVDDPDEKAVALQALVEHVVPGRLAEARPPNERELTRTLVLALALHETSVKVRGGAPLDDPEDLAWPAWAGVVPLALSAAIPEADEFTPSDFPVPEYAQHYRRPGVFDDASKRGGS